MEVSAFREWKDPQTTLISRRCGRFSRQIESVWALGKRVFAKESKVEYAGGMRRMDGPFGCVRGRFLSSVPLAFTCLVYGVFAPLAVALEPARTENVPDYVVLVSDSVARDSSWAEVVERLVARHSGACIVYDGYDVRSVESELKEMHPVYICLVASPEYILGHNLRKLVRDLYDLTRHVDEDVYGDAIWGIVTGYNVDDALRIASGPDSIGISNALLCTAGTWLDHFEQGVYFSELTYREMWYKVLRGQVIRTMTGPTDPTDTLCALLNSDSVDIMITSGHASEHNWQLHFPNAGLAGFFRSGPGAQLYGESHSGHKTLIRTQNPKIYYAPGNCLIGNIPDRNCMALSWIHTGGAYQIAAYTVETWYGYAGWGISNYFVLLNSRFSLAEAFFLNNQSLLFDLQNHTPGRNYEGLLHDRDAMVLYGDPACRAKLVDAHTPVRYTQDVRLIGSGTAVDTFAFEVTMSQDGYPGCYPAAILPFRADSVRVISTNAKHAVVTERFVLLDIAEAGDPYPRKGAKRRVVFAVAKSSPSGGTNNHALALEGHSYIRVPNSRSLNLEHAITFECWIRTRGSESFSGTLISKRDSTIDLGAEYVITVGPRYQSFLYSSRDRPIWQEYRIDENLYPILSDTNWHHLAFSFVWGDGNSASFYIDGILRPGHWIIGDGSQSPYVSNADVSIGAQLVASAPVYVKGILDEVRLWSKARSADEIRSTMYRKLSGREPGLVGYWNFDAQDFRDSSPNHNDGIPHGDPEIVPVDFGWEQQGTSSVRVNSEIVKDWALLQNHPNPFNPVTEISFVVPCAVHAKLTVLDARGRVVRTPVDGPVAAGRHRISFDASGLPSGIYFYMLQAGSFTQTRKMLLLK